MKFKPANQNKIILRVFVLLTMACSSVLTQVSKQWDISYNGPGNGIDNAASLAVDGAGNVYVTGWSLGTSNDYATVKYNSSGVQQWVKRYDGGNANDYGYAIAVDQSGNIYVTGTSQIAATGYDYLTIKYNSAGTVVWSKRYDGGISGIDKAVAIAVDDSSNVYVTGSSSAIAGTADFVTIKYNSSGVQQWVKAFTGGGTGSDLPSAIVVDVSHNVYVTGKCFETNTNYDYLTVKYSPGGSLLWFKKYAAYNANEDGANAIAVDASGNVYVTGSSRMGSTAATSDYATIKYNSSGVQQWVMRYNGPGSSQDDAKSVAVDGSGNVIVTGASYGGASSFDIATIKYNSSGQVQWVKRENSQSNLADRGYSVAIDGSGNVFVTGSTVSSLSSSEDYFTVKYSPAGVLLWSQTENGAANSHDIASVLKLDIAGNVYITGYSTSNTGEDYKTIKYTQPMGITSLSGEIPASFELHQNYPNPFNPVTNIKFSIPKSGLVKLVVYDISGREAASLVNQDLNAGSYRYDFDASHLSSGAYFYRLTADGFTDVKKMMLIK